MFLNVKEINVTILLLCTFTQYTLSQVIFKNHRFNYTYCSTCDILLNWKNTFCIFMEVWKNVYIEFKHIKDLIMLYSKYYKNSLNYVTSFIFLFYTLNNNFQILNLIRYFEYLIFKHRTEFKNTNYGDKDFWIFQFLHPYKVGQRKIKLTLLLKKS